MLEKEQIKPKDSRMEEIQLGQELNRKQINRKQRIIKDKYWFFEKAINIKKLLTRTVKEDIINKFMTISLKIHVKSSLLHASIVCSFLFSVVFHSMDMPQYVTIYLCKESGLIRVWGYHE